MTSVAGSINFLNSFKDIKSPMSKNIHLSIAVIYAEGLVKALEQNPSKMESAWRELDQLWRFAVAQKNFEAFMLTPSIPLREKNLLLDNCYKAVDAFQVCEAIITKSQAVYISAEVRIFCKLLLKSGRFSLFRMILEVLENLVLKSQGKVKAFVTSATKLLQEEIQILKNFLETHFEKKIQMVFREDKSLIGGVVVRVEDKIFDGSIQKQLEKLKIKLCDGNVLF